MFEEYMEKYKDGHGCCVILEVKDGKNISVEMSAVGDNNATLQALCAAFMHIAESKGVKPSDLLPFITSRLVKESE